MPQRNISGLGEMQELQHSRYLENWYLEAGLDLEASDF